jgi:hypothetical protein
LCDGESATGEARIDAFKPVLHVKGFVLFNFSWNAIKLGEKTLSDSRV